MSRDKRDFMRMLSDQNKAALVEHGEEIVIPKGNYVYHQGDPSRAIYILQQGEISILKTVDGEVLTVNAHQAGIVFGEFGFYDDQNRPVSVCAAEDCHLLKVPYQVIEKLIDGAVLTQDFLQQLGKLYAYKMHQLEEEAARRSMKHLREIDNRIRDGYFFVTVIFLICVYAYSLDWLINLLKSVQDSTFITIPMMVVIFGFLLMMIKITGQSREHLGLTLKNTKRSVFEGTVFSILLLPIFLLGKFILIHTVPSLAGRPLLEFYHVMGNGPGAKFDWWADLIVYVLIVSPFQAFIVRGGLQGSLMHFLKIPYSGLVAIVLSNLIYSTFHLFMSVQVSLVVFFAGLYVGWLYHRNQNVIGVSIAHAIIGVWGLFIMGSPWPVS